MVSSFDKFHTEKRKVAVTARLENKMNSHWVGIANNYFKSVATDA